MLLPSVNDGSAQVVAKVNLDLAKTKGELERRRRELKNRAERVNSDLHRVDGALSPDFSEQAVEVQNDATLTEIGRTAVEEIRQIDEALARLAAGEYGQCKSCGGPIEVGRLAVRPESVTCTACESSVGHR